METLTIGDAFVNAMWAIILASMPILLVAMCVGLITGILQTATSIQEQTLAFIPKMLAVIVSLLIFGPWMFRIVGGLAINLFTNMHRYVG
ncbi:MAG: flagellar biosynthetic protein FliQ [Synergistaceae bacterium]|jgi:flagellar biosynthetic protein FliQ|nr:flagellar biosynthetic protein FliQ [Synergistaceae bacterium]